MFMAFAKEEYLLGILRIFLGLMLVWAFFDKLLGLGFSTSPERSWLAGVSPIEGFLTNAVRGPFAEFYHAIAQSQLAVYLFMLGILLIGLSLIFGIFMRLACWSGAILFLSMWTALLPPVNHPFLDEHVIYLFLLITLYFARAGRFLGCGNLWSKTKLVKRFHFLE